LSAIDGAVEAGAADCCAAAALENAAFEKKHAAAARMSDSLDGMLDRIGFSPFRILYTC
jgi:hypothetical protein